MLAVELTGQMAATASSRRKIELAGFLTNHLHPEVERGVTERTNGTNKNLWNGKRRCTSRFQGSEIRWNDIDEAKVRGTKVTVKDFGHMR